MTAVKKKNNKTCIKRIIANDVPTPNYSSVTDLNKVIVQNETEWKMSDRRDEAISPAGS